MADYVLSVKVTGDAADFEKTMKEAGATFEELKKQTESTSFGKLSGQFNKIGGQLKSVGSKLTNSITKPALAAGAALSTIVIAKGWSRMTKIDDARAKLSALGNSAKDVQMIMDNALESVKGTAYGMDAAATTAASAVASGIKPGQQLTQYLTDVADAAAVAGIDMSEMGAIFNKVTANGKMSAEEMNQLADRGIPVMSLLAKTTGMSMEEVRSAVSSGKIGIKELQKAIEEGMGGAAQEIGSTTITGAISNVGAAISRIGAAFLGSSDDANTFSGQILPLLNNFTEWLDNMQPKAEELGKVFGEVFGGLTDFFTKDEVDWSGLSESAQGVLTALQPLMTIVKTVGEWFGSLGTKAQTSLIMIALGIGPVLSIMGSLAGVAGTVFGFFGKLGGAATSVTTLGTASTTASSGIGSMAKNLLVAAAAVALVGVGVAAAGLGFKMMASAATSLAAAGGAAIAVFFGMVAAFAGLIIVVGALGPASIAAGAAIALVGAGLALAGAGALMLGKGIKAAAEGLKIVAKHGKTAASGITAIGKAATGLKLSSILKLGGLAAEFKTLGNSSKKAANSFRSISSSAKTAGSTFKTFQSAVSSSVSAASKTLDTFKKKVNEIGNLKPKVSIGVGHVPHFSVSWNTHSKNGTTVSTPSISYWAKGGIFDGASLLNGLNVVGEAGPEAVAPITTLQSYVTEAVEKSETKNGGNTYYFGDITLDVSSLEDVTTIEDIADIFKRAKAFA